MARFLYDNALSIICCGLCVWSSVAVAQEDECSRLIPPSGAYQIVLQDGTTTSYSTAKDWFCSEDFLRYAQQSNMSAGVTVPTEYGVGNGTFNSGNQEQLQQRTKFCQDSSTTFSQSAKELLYLKQGDPTLVNGFIQCIQARRLQFLTAGAKLETENVFSVSVEAKYYPGPPPQIISVAAVDGAIPISVTSFAPSKVIPFNAAPLTGTFKFDQGRTDALVEVSTTLGDKTIVVRKCRRGVAGNWSVVGTESEVHEDSAGTFEMPIQLPQASCHPYCKPGQGDWHTYDMVAGPDLVIRNPHFQCSGDGCRFDSNQQFFQESEQHIQFKVLGRSLSDSYKLAADQFRHTKVPVDKSLSNGELQFGAAVSLTVPAGARVKLDGVFGTPLLTPEMLSAGQLDGMVGWLQAAGPPETTPSGTIYSYKVVDPACTQ